MNIKEDFPYIEYESRADEELEDLKTGAFLIVVAFLSLLAAVWGAWWYLWIL